MRGLLPFFVPTFVSQRARATYYQQRKTIVPAFIRRFLLRYPQSPLYIVFALLSSTMIIPTCKSVYMYMTLSPEEFKDYCAKRKRLVRERQKYGNALWIPFYSKGELPEEVLQQTESTKI